MLAKSSYKLKKYGECLYAIAISLSLETKQLQTSSINEENSTPVLNKVFLGYLKAKSLCKLHRYSESLFQLAKIEQMLGKLEQLPERQRSKLMLYKAVCLMETKQYKQTVQILSAVLNQLEPQHTQLQLLQDDDKKSLLNLLI